MNSTANTVRPALQVIKTKPGQKLVSGAFLMCFKDHVAVFSDCAINLNPDAEQLSEIALQSAETARARHRPEGRYALLLHSRSGRDRSVDMVEEATKLLKEKAPYLPVVGSIQFDAAWSPTVAATKARATMWPDTSTCSSSRTVRRQHRLQSRAALLRRLAIGGAAGSQQAGKRTCPVVLWCRTSSTPSPSPPSKRSEPGLAPGGSRQREPP